MGKIFNFDLKKQLQLVKDLEVIAFAFVSLLLLNQKTTVVTSLFASLTPFVNPYFPKGIDDLFDKNNHIAVDMV